MLDVAVLCRELQSLPGFSSAPGGEAHLFSLLERKYKCCVCDRSRYWYVMGRKVHGKS